jgi:hypothetical protein
MRRLLATCLLLALGLLAARSFGEELQWRSATPIKSDSSPAVSASSPWNAAPAPVNQSPATTLSKPVAVNNVTPVDFRGVPLVRGSMADDIRDVKVMPLGPPATGNSISSGGGDKQKTEVIPVQPQVISPSSPKLGGDSTSWFSGPIMGDDCCGCGTVCGDCCGCFNDCCGCCRDRGCCWFNAEYLAWRVSRQNMPVLLATFPNGTSEASIMNGTALGGRSLIDAGNLPSDDRSGGRFTFGFWLPHCDDLGLEASYFFLGTRTSSAAFASGGSPILAIPFIDDATGQPRNAITAHPGPPVAVAGSFAMNATSQVWGVEMNLRQKLCCGPCFFVDLLYGYRHIQLNDGINILDVESPQNIPGSQPIQISESFGARTQFNGGQIGVEGEWHFLPRCFVGAQAKLALGNSTQTVTIRGQAIPAFDLMGNSNLTLHAEDNNIGQFTHNRFAVSTEALLKLGYDVTDHLRVWIGYDVLFLSSVVRAGDQIDTTFTFPNGQGPRPAVLFKTTSWVGQGFNVGLQYTF